MKAPLALVILPGLDGTTALLTGFVDSVRPGFASVAAIPYPNDRALNYTELERAVRRALPIDAAFVLLGESFSGPVALSIAANPPPGLVGVVLSTTFAKNPVSLLRPLAGLTRFAPVRAMPLRILSWLLLGRWATPKLEALLRDALQSVAPDVLRARATAALRADVTPCLDGIKVPVLYLRATEDRLLLPGVGEYILRAIPHAQLITIAGPHLLLQTAPGAAANAIAAFAAQLRQTVH
jgi:pimeloyl-[acyl-carrier protein] methyl ester esterase